MSHTITRYLDEQRSPELVYLDQIIALDGEEEVVVSRKVLRNGSGRIVGEELEVSDETAEFIAECLRRDKESGGK